jgi:GntR family transcriptional regulator, transcriptional repressor for pyruvate dehydrogenase complex
VRRGTSKKMYEQVADHIKTMIEQGHLQPGDKLAPMSELATHFGVSRATVREAFSSLVGMGLIDLRHGEGTFVQKIDVQTMIIEPMNAALLLGRSELYELLEVREMLEEHTVRLACERATEDELARLQEALARMSQPRQNTEELVSADMQYHIAIAECAHNLVLVNLMNTLSEPIRSLQYARWEAEEEERHALIEQHRHLYHAIAAQDSKRATRLIREHLQHSERVVQKIRAQNQTNK